MTCASCCRNSPGAVSACAAAAFLSASACSNCGSFDSASCVLADLGVGHLLVGLVLAGREVELLGRRRLRHGAGRRDRHRLPGRLRSHRRDRLRHRLRLVRRRLGRRLDVLGLALLALGDQTLDLALDLTGLAGGLVVVGLLQRLRRLRLDGRLHRGDERLLVERPRLLGVHRVGLGRLGLRPDVAGRGQRRVLGLLGLRRGRRVRPLLPGRGLDLAGDRREGRVVLRAYAGRAGPAAAAARPPPAAPGRQRRRVRRSAGAAPAAAGFAPALAWPLGGSPPWPPPGRAD